MCDLLDSGRQESKRAGEEGKHDIVRRGVTVKYCEDA